MAVCELTGKKPVVKNWVSHSNKKTHRWVYPNVQPKKLWSEILKRQVQLKVATSTLRSIEHVGGFDTFILRQPDDVLSHRALKIKKLIRQRLKSRDKGKSRAS